MSQTASIPSTASVAIVGGGIVGVATALFLARKGIQSVVLETESTLGTRTTAMSAHCIRAQFGEPENIRMMAESLAFYEDLNDQCGFNSRADIGLTQQGYLFASTDPMDEALFAQRIADQGRAGLTDVELLTGEEIRSRFPWLTEDIATGTFRQRDGWISSARAVEAMAIASGQPIHTGVVVESIAVESGRVTGVNTSLGPIATNTIVLAAGPFSRRLSPEPLPVKLLRRHRLIVAPRPDIPQEGPVLIDANTGSHWRPHNGGALAAWAQPAEDEPDQWPVPADPVFVDLILRSDGGIARLSPFWGAIADALAPDEITLTAGQYTITPDHRPLIGRAVQTEGLFLHTGYSGHGIMGAPSGARLLADIIHGTQPVPNPFDPCRFTTGSAPPDVERVII